MLKYSFHKASLKFVNFLLKGHLVGTGTICFLSEGHKAPSPLLIERKILEECRMLNRLRKKLLYLLTDILY